MRNSLAGVVRSYLRSSNRWLLRTPERALNQAYDAAVLIKGLEDAHFGGNRVAFDSGSYSKSAQSYFESELKKNLDIIKIRLAEFRASSSIVRLSNQATTEVQLDENSSELSPLNVVDQPNLILKKLRFIDEILARYENRATNPLSQVVVTEPKAIVTDLPGRMILPASPEAERNSKSITDKTGVLPRSILETVDRIRRDLDPEAEQQVVQTFRQSRFKTNIAIRFMLLLVIVPLLTHQISKNFLVGPIVDRFRADHEAAEIFMNTELEEEGLDELMRFEQRLRFEVLIGKIQPQEESEIVEQVREKAAEIESEYRLMGSNAIKNIFSDLLSLAAFAIVIVSSKREIAVVKSFMDEVVYGLSDSAKAFIIILFTDIFVGFHSPHGWEVLLEGAAKHLGIAANHDFIFLFIATFPVILDTIFKYWIFRYLNRVSPSAVATYKNMNE
ncbi:MAG: proton extrusion protein PcxA [Oscillatoriophycideae cyanobacterium NC_groundwater_1537_Pr4_S-0.65um_50_18]|nr:proton extrusion protein PcxA [Oscillatoriophycideae cyanobacterium NC_groundwater_1537_Pr4_S-0.65um_50_18]